MIKKVSGRENIRVILELMCVVVEESEEQSGRRLWIMTYPSEFLHRVFTQRQIDVQMPHVIGLTEPLGADSLQGRKNSRKYAALQVVNAHQHEGVGSERGSIRIIDS